MTVMSQGNPVQLAYFLASVPTGVDTEQKMLESSTVDSLLSLTHAARANS
jgi:hypothetical protein